MYQMDKSTAGMRVVRREAKTWKSHVNATMRHVRSRFGSLRLPLTWPIDDDRSGPLTSLGMELTVFADAAPPKEN